MVRADTFQLITELPMKFVPFTVKVNTGAPAVTLAGESEVMAGTGLVETELMVNTDTFDVPPPGVGLNTVILAVPATATNVTLTDAVSCVALINVVANAVPFQLMTELLIKLAPVTVSINAGSPTVTLAGEMEDTAGTGFTVPDPPFDVSLFLQEKRVANTRIAVNNLV